MLVSAIVAFSYQEITSDLRIKEITVIIIIEFIGTSIFTWFI